MQLGLVKKLARLRYCLFWCGLAQLSLKFNCTSFNGGFNFKELSTVVEIIYFVYNVVHFKIPTWLKNYCCIFLSASSNSNHWTGKRFNWKKPRPLYQGIAVSQQ